MPDVDVVHALVESQQLDKSYSILPDYQKRVVDERGELDKKIVNLTKFMLTSTFNTLSVDEQERLSRQKEAMMVYSSILSERIDVFLKDVEQKEGQ